MIPEKAQGKVNQAVVVAIGPGVKDKVCLHFLIDAFECLLALQEGKVNPPKVKVGEKVLVPEYGGTKLTIDEQVLYSVLHFAEKQCE